MKKAILGALVSAALVVPSFYCLAQTVLPGWTSRNGEMWTPPAEGVIRDRRAAISIARLALLSMHPELGSKIGSDEVWQDEMVAKLQDGVWEVSNPGQTGEIGGALFIYLSKNDGRVVGVFLTQ